MHVRGPGAGTRPQQVGIPVVADLGVGVVVAGGDEHRRAPRNLEGPHREPQRVGIHALLIEQVAGEQDRVHPALDRLLDRQLERAALVLSALGAAIGGNPPERTTQVEVGDLEELDDGHSGLNPPSRLGRARYGPQRIRKAVPEQRVVRSGRGS